MSFIDTCEKLKRYSHVPEYKNYEAPCALIVRWRSVDDGFESTIVHLKDNFEDAYNHMMNNIHNIQVD